MRDGSEVAHASSPHRVVASIGLAMDLLSTARHTCVKGRCRGGFWLYPHGASLVASFNGS